jgi:hypothetical protein
MVNLFDEDSGFLELPMPGATTDPQTGVTDFNLGVAPPLTEQQKKEAFDSSAYHKGEDFVIGKIVDGFANMYDRLAPSEESLAELREVQEGNQAIADKYNIPLKTLYQMSAYGGDNEKILEDLGFRKYTMGQDLTRTREFLYSAQQKGFNKLKEGTDFMDLSGEEMFGIVLSPLDMLDFAGLSFGLAGLVRKGIAKLGGSASKMNLVDLAKNKEVMKTLSYEEAQDVIQKLKPVIDGEQEFLLRFDTGQPTTSKTTGTLTAKDEMLGLGDDLRAPKQIQDNPNLKNETRPVKTTEVEGPVTIDDVLETTQQNLSRKKAFEGMRPEDIIGKGDEGPKDVFLTPGEPIAAPVEKIVPKTIEEVKEVKAKIDAVDVAQFQIFQDLPKGVRGAGLNPQKRKILEDFVEIMKSGDPFRIAALYRKTPDKTLTAIKKAAVQQKLITESEIAAASKQGEIVGLKKATNDAQDRAVRASNQLEKWKAGEIESVGGGKITFRELIKIFKEDPVLAAYIGDEVSMADKPFKGGALKNLTNEEQWLSSVRDSKLQNILKLIKPQLDELPLASPYAIRETIEPTKYVREFEYVLSEPQRLIRDNVRNKLREKLKQADFPIDPVRGKDFIAKGVERIIESGGTVEEAIEQIKNIDTDRLAELLIGREKFNVERQFYNDELEDVAKLFGEGEVPFEKVELGHIEAVEENIERTLEINNLFLQGRGPNRAEQSVRKEIKQLKSLFKEATTGDEKRNIITKMMDLDKQLAESGSITKIDGQTFGAMPEDDFLDIGENILDEMKYAKGGIVEERPAGPGLPPQDLDIFQDDLPEGSYETANLMLPFFKLFGKAPVNEVAPIPIPKDKLTNPTKKQAESLESTKAKRAEEDIFDPTPNEAVELDPAMPVEVTPLTNQPMTSVFYSDIERAMTNAPDQFANKQELLDFLNKNRIKKSEVNDYRINALLRLYDENMPIPKGDVLSQVRSAPISGMRVHATGQGSEIINPNGVSRTRYEGYAKDGFIEGSQRERVLYINRDKLPGDTGEYPQSMFGGEQIFRHEFGIPNEADTYVVGWTRLTDRFGFVPPKVAGPETKINLRQTTKELNKNQRSLQGLYAEARSKIERLANQRGMSQNDINDILLDFGGDNPKLSIIAKYADQLDEISPGLVNQMDELVVKNRELQEKITRASGVDPSGVVRVTFADEIQSDILQAAAIRKQQLTAALRKIQEEGNTTNLQGLNRLAEATMDFYEKNKSVFRPLKKTDAEVNVLAQRVAKMDEEVDAIVGKYLETREVSDADLSRLSTLLNDNLDSMMKELIDIDSNAIDGLFPDLPFKNRDEWADALIKKDLYELAYRKFVLKDPDASSYYAVSPSKYVIDRYSFSGNAATSAADRAADKQRRFDVFKRSGEFRDSQYKGIGMDEFYGGPDSVSNVIDNSGTAATNPNFGKPKHYTSTIETILKRQAQSNNSEMITMPVQVKSGRGATQYRVTDQNGNMVATLTNEDQARQLLVSNPNYRIQPISIPNKKDMEPVFAIKITPEMLEPYKTHKAQGGLVEHIDIFEV